MEHEAHVFFAVFEFGHDANVVTQLAGFQPTDYWVVGQPIKQGSAVTRRFSRWTFRSPLPLSAPVEAHLEALLPTLEQHSAGIRAVRSRFSAHIACAIYFRTHTSGFNLSEKVTARVAALGLALDFDLYFLGVCETSDTDDHTA